MNSRFLSATGLSLGAFIVLVAANGEEFFKALMGLPTLVQAWSAVLPFGVWSTLLALLVSMGLWAFSIRWMPDTVAGRPPELAADVLAVIVSIAATVTQVTGKDAAALLQAIWMGLAAGFLAPLLCRAIRSAAAKPVVPKPPKPPGGA